MMSCSSELLAALQETCMLVLLLLIVGQMRVCMRQLFDTLSVVQV